MSEAAVMTIQPARSLRVMPARTFTGDLFQRFIEYTDCKDSTIKGYVTCIKAFARWMQAQGVTQPTREDVKAYKEYLAGSEYKAGTQAQYLRAVKHFFKWTAAEGLYPNIADNIKGAKIRHDQHKKDALGRADVPAIAATIDRTTEQGKRLYALYLLCITCGLRTVEVTRANVEDIKTLGGRAYLYIQGKGHDEKDAPVMLTPEVKAALDEYLTARTDRPTGKSPLFTSTSNRSKGGRIASTTISTILKTLLKSAGYDSDRLTAHSLRHTSGTGAYMATHNLFLAQQHQRHADPATTEIYVHAEDRAQRDTEQQVFDYYFKQDTEQSAAAEAIAIINRLPADKLDKALAVLRAIQ
jgi:integrase/recombinase XerC